MSKYDATEEDLAYLQSAISEEELPKGPPSKIRSLLSAAPKGALLMLGEELQKIREAPEKLPGGIGEFFESMNIDFEASPIGTSPQQKQQQIKEALPTREGYVENSLERGGAIAPFALAGGGGIAEGVLRSVAAGFLGEGAKEMGFGPFGQAVAEIPAFGVPKLGKKIQTEGAVGEELAEFARAQGLTEEQLALSLGDRGAIRDLASDMAAKGGRAAKAFDSTKDALGRVWNTLRQSPEAKMTLDSKQSSNLTGRIHNKLKKLPSEMRNKVQEDFNDLVGSKMSLDDVVDFWQDLNYYIRKGDKGLGILKEDLQGAINQVSPEFGREFRLTNELYGNFAELASKMKPDMAEHLIQAGERGMLVAGIIEGNYPKLKGVLGAVGARQLALEMVKNPRLQRLSSQFISAANRNKPAIAKKVYDMMQIEIGKTSSEAAQQMADLDINSMLQSMQDED